MSQQPLLLSDCESLLLILFFTFENSDHYLPPGSVFFFLFDWVQVLSLLTCFSFFGLYTSRFFFLDDITGFEITYILELSEPYSFIFTWFAAVPLLVYLALTITKLIIKDFLILKVKKTMITLKVCIRKSPWRMFLSLYVFVWQGPCPNCGTENTSFFGTILSISSGGKTNTLKCTK